ncbi:MAG: nicotinate-nucleotide--dimethylbenzimidazole phosphoribosyltransferase [Desulfovibrio sp.]|nr:nicotinate-nucleotide--dimethylbenzimidazole phosphoribosyltransferase [Desulfovibrio sp.]
MLRSIDPCFAIQPLNPALLAEGQEILDSLTKPRGSLGRLEEIARRLFAIQGGRRPLQVSPAMLYTVAGDHGVARQGVSAFPQSVTRQMVENFLAGGGAINVLCEENGLALSLVDAGCRGGPFPPHPMLLDHRLGDGTADLSTGCAMTRQQALQGLSSGILLSRDASQNGSQCIACGEMGIGNTTPATALFCAFLQCDPDQITGPGTGVDRETLLHKISVIKNALSLHKNVINEGDPLDILAALGGFEIAVMAGIMLGAAAEGLPFLVDGFIATSAYVVARALDPVLSQYAFCSHSSAEPGYQHIMRALGEKPLLDLGFRLGEGTGAAVCYPLLRSACAVMNRMATFTNANISGALCGGNA